MVFRKTVLLLVLILSHASAMPVLSPLKNVVVHSYGGKGDARDSGTYNLLSGLNYDALKQQGPFRRPSHQAPPWQSTRIEGHDVSSSTAGEHAQARHNAGNRSESGFKAAGEESKQPDSTDKAVSGLVSKGDQLRLDVISESISAPYEIIKGHNSGDELAVIPSADAEILGERGSDPVKELVDNPDKTEFGNPISGPGVTFASSLMSSETTSAFRPSSSTHNSATWKARRDDPEQIQTVLQITSVAEASSTLSDDTIADFFSSVCGGTPSSQGLQAIRDFAASTLDVQNIIYHPNVSSTSISPLCVFLWESITAPGTMTTPPSTWRMKTPLGWNQVSPKSEAERYVFSTSTSTSSSTSTSTSTSTTHVNPSSSTEWTWLSYSDDGRRYGVESTTSWPQLLESPSTEQSSISPWWDPTFHLPTKNKTVTPPFASSFSMTSYANPSSNLSVESQLVTADFLESSEGKSTEVSTSMTEKLSSSAVISSWPSTTFSAKTSNSFDPSPTVMPPSELATSPSLNFQNPWVLNKDAAYPLEGGVSTKAISPWQTLAPCFIWTTNYLTSGWKTKQSNNFFDKKTVHSSDFNPWTSNLENSGAKREQTTVQPTTVTSGFHLSTVTHPWLQEESSPTRYNAGFDYQGITRSVDFTSDDSTIHFIPSSHEQTQKYDAVDPAGKEPATEAAGTRVTLSTSAAMSPWSSTQPPGAMTTKPPSNTYPTLTGPVMPYKADVSDLGREASIAFSESSSTRLLAEDAVTNTLPWYRFSTSHPASQKGSPPCAVRIHERPTLSEIDRCILFMLNQSSMTASLSEVSRLRKKIVTQLMQNHRENKMKIWPWIVVDLFEEMEKITGVEGPYSPGTSKGTSGSKRTSRQASQSPISKRRMKRSSRQASQSPISKRRMKRSSRQASQSPISKRRMKRSSRQASQSLISKRRMKRTSRQASQSPISKRRMKRSSRHIMPHVWAGDMDNVPANQERKLDWAGGIKIHDHHHHHHHRHRPHRHADHHHHHPHHVHPRPRHHHLHHVHPRPRHHHPDHVHPRPRHHHPRPRGRWEHRWMRRQRRGWMKQSGNPQVSHLLGVINDWISSLDNQALTDTRTGRSTWTSWGGSMTPTKRWTMKAKKEATIRASSAKSSAAL